MRCEVVPQSLFRRRPVRCNAARVQIKREPRDADLVQIMDQHCDTFRIQFGRNLSGVFDADLVKLPSASSRRPFAAEHGTDIEYAVFDAVQRIGSGEGAHDSGGSFRAESETASAAVFKRIHLFFHDFGFVAEPALEDFGIFENRGPELSVAIERKDFFCGVFEETPGGRFFGQNVAGSRRRC